MRRSRVRRLKESDWRQDGQNIQSALFSPVLRARERASAHTARASAASGASSSSRRACSTVRERER